MFGKVSKCISTVALFFFLVQPVFLAQSMPVPQKDYQEYLKFFEEVYQTFETNYYTDPSRTVFDHFIQKFNANIYQQLKSEGKSDDYVRWRSAWFLVDALKSSDDKFSQFYPPKPAVKFQKEALGQRTDLGIEGQKSKDGFLVTRLEPRSDAYVQGLRENDLITVIDRKSVKPLKQADIDAKLNPLVGATVAITYIPSEQKAQKTISVMSKDYFKQTVFLRPVPVPGVFCLEIPKFNRTTGEDLFRFLEWIEPQNPRGLVLDLRDNPGGPPLAAREIAAFFLKGGEEFAYFQKRGPDKADLDVPAIAEQYQFKAPIVILVNEESGSASELFTGIMQFRGRAVVMGTTTAGQVMLKSMFPMKDGSMVALVTGLGHYPDGKSFGFSGVVPNEIITNAPKEGLINLAATYLALKDQRKN